MPVCRPSNASGWIVRRFEGGLRNVDSTRIQGCAPAVGASAEPQGVVRADSAKKPGAYDTTEKSTPYEDITTYNNYYEFGIDKSDPAKNSRNFKPKPWTVKVEGMCSKPGTYSFDDLLKGVTVEDRIYRMRCVEAWSMVIPWQGVPLADVIKKLEPTSSAKYVEFKTLGDPNQYPEQRR